MDSYFLAPRRAARGDRGGASPRRARVDEEALAPEPEPAPAPAPAARPKLRRRCVVVTAPAAASVALLVVVVVVDAVSMAMPPRPKLRRRTTGERSVEPAPMLRRGWRGDRLDSLTEDALLPRRTERREPRGERDDSITSPSSSNLIWDKSPKMTNSTRRFLLAPAVLAWNRGFEYPWPTQLQDNNTRVRQVTTTPQHCNNSTTHSWRARSMPKLARRMRICRARPMDNVCAWAGV